MRMSTVYERLGVQSSLFVPHAGWSDPASALLSGTEREAVAHASIAAEIYHFVHCVLIRRRPIAGLEDARLALAVVRLPPEGPS